MILLSLQTLPANNNSNHQPDINRHHISNCFEKMDEWIVQDDSSGDKIHFTAFHADGSYAIIQSTNQNEMIKTDLLIEEMNSINFELDLVLDDIKISEFDFSIHTQWSSKSSRALIVFLANNEAFLNGLTISIFSKEAIFQDRCNEIMHGLASN